MSESVTNIEIEDVLSSIRRLVSEETRKNTGTSTKISSDAFTGTAAKDDPSPLDAPIGSGQGRPHRPTSTVAADKLVLTPALRVAGVAEPLAEAEDAAHTDLADEVDVPDDTPTQPALTFLAPAPYSADDPKAQADAPGASQSADIAEPRDADQGLTGADEPLDLAGVQSTASVQDDGTGVSANDKFGGVAPVEGDIQDEAALAEDATMRAGDPPDRGVLIAGPENTDGPPWRDPNATLYSAAEAAEAEPAEAETVEAEPAEAETVEAGAMGISDDTDDDVTEGAVESTLHADAIVFASAPADPGTEDVSDTAVTVTDSAEADPQVTAVSEEPPQESGDGDVLETSQAADDAIQETQATRDRAPLRSEPPALDGLASKIAALESRLGRREELYDPDEPGTSAYAGVPVGSVAWDDPLTVSDEASAPSETEPDPADAAAQEPQSDAISADDQIATWSDGLDEDAPETEGDVETDDQVDEEIEADVARREAEEANADIFATDETILDEATLRELVTDIVREELQGALGERITRNVRKLVRREIHRALAAQELD